jgi:hypothetical protein
MEESKARTNRYANQTEEVGLDRIHAKEATIQHHKPGLNLESTGQKKRERPRNTRMRDTESELKEHDTTWQEAAKAAQNRVRWRTVVDGQGRIQLFT